MPLAQKAQTMPLTSALMLEVAQALAENSMAMNNAMVFFMMTPEF
jgi:hypothetical protein